MIFKDLPSLYMINNRLVQVVVPTPFPHKMMLGASFDDERRSRATANPRVGAVTDRQCIDAFMKANFRTALDDVVPHPVT